MKKQYYLYKYGGCKFKKRKLFDKGEIKVCRFGVTIIKGKNGTGKSTLLKKMYHVSDGAGVYVAQENEEIFEKLSVVENISLMQETVSEYGIEELLAKYDLEQLLEKDCSTLSGGEKRIISILRGIRADDEIIYMDEPTNDLDFRIVDILRRIIIDYKGKKTFIIITHDERLLPLAEIIYEIEGGKLNIQHKDCEFGEQAEYGRRKKKIGENKSFLKRILSIDICNYMSILFVTLISLFFFVNVIQRMNVSIERINDNQVELCNTLYKPAEELLREGYIPTYMISLINDGMSASEMEEKVQALLKDSENELYSLSLDIKDTEYYNAYTLSMFDLQQGIQYSVLDVCLENIYNKDSTKYFLDTSDFFQTHGQSDDKTPIAFDKEAYQDAIKYIEENSESELEKSFVVVNLLNEYGFEKFIEQPELMDLWDANYFIRSNETIYLVETAMRLNGYKSVIKMWGGILLVLLIITAINSMLYVRTVLKPAKILMNYGVPMKSILQAIDNRCVNKKWLSVVVVAVEISMIVLMLIYRNIWDVRELIIPISYLVVIVILNVFQKVLIKRQIARMFRVEGELQCE